ncbi:hypothetical protein VTP01DRAFT_8295 [Rhizomucor pusillus]|uniref:uncharacterized protein n=1 Tax=Rhizomucor pusillus TaxID=4840 RepID=UPI003743FE7C
MMIRLVVSATFNHCEESVELEDLDIAAAVAPVCPTTPVAPKTAVESPLEISELLHANVVRGPPSLYIRLPQLYHVVVSEAGERC